MDLSGASYDIPRPHLNRVVTYIYGLTFAHLFCHDYTPTQVEGHCSFGIYFSRLNDRRFIL